MHSWSNIKYELKMFEKLLQTNWRPEKSLMGVISKSNREEKSKGGNKIVLHNLKNIHTREQNILEQSTLWGFSRWMVLLLCLFSYRSQKVSNVLTNMTESIGMSDISP